MRYKSNFHKLMELKSNYKWLNYKILATTNKQIGKIESGTKVIIWMVSRFGDVGITSNLERPIGYDERGVDPDNDLIDLEFIPKDKKQSHDDDCGCSKCV